MAEPMSPDHAVPASRRGFCCMHAIGRVASVAMVLEIAFALRVVAADAVEWFVRRGDSSTICIFPDTISYWELARTIRAGAPYQIVEWSDIPHYALRTPGYPLFLAVCQAVFGEQTLSVRLVQSILGVISVYLVYCLTSQFSLSKDSQFVSKGPAQTTRWRLPIFAAVLAAVNPHYLLISSLILSEAVFVPLMLAALLGTAILWRESSIGTSGWRLRLIGLGTGIASGAAILVRPSWALFVPGMLAAWLAASLGNRNKLAEFTRGIVCFGLGLVLVMGPWWIRNFQVFGRFVPTALWMGASLYDGINPNATGASDMTFLGDPEIWPLDEQDQDAELIRRSIDFARKEPYRVFTLAIVKFGRYWSPWPNAEGISSPLVTVASSVLEIPLFVLMMMGLWGRRADPRVWVFLAGPMLYFCILHMVFASSMRYRIPAEMPGLGLAALGWARLVTWRKLEEN